VSRMNSLIILMAGIVIGVFIFPLILFLRARRSDHWDNSNMMNIYRVLAYLATHPDKFGEMYFKDGKKSFPYIGMDEFKDIVSKL